MSINKVKLAYIIDDDEIIQYLTEQMFSQIEFCEQSRFFLDPQDAFKNLKASLSESGEIPDLILLDLKMPEMDGWCFLNEMEKLSLKKEIPVFMFSSSINEDDIDRSKQYKFVRDYIVKPLTVHKINKILRMLDS